MTAPVTDIHRKVSRRLTTFLSNNKSADRVAAEIIQLVCAQADRNPEGHDREAGHGAEHESPVVASSDDAPNPSQDTA